MEKGFIKEMKKLSNKDYVDEKTKRKFKDGQILYSKSLQSYVQTKSFEVEDLVYKCRLYGM